MKDLAEEEASNLAGWFEDQRQVYQAGQSKSATEFLKFAGCMDGRGCLRSVCGVLLPRAGGRRWRTDGEAGEATGHGFGHLSCASPWVKRPRR